MNLSEREQSQFDEYIHCLLYQDVTKLSFEEVYRFFFNLVNQKYGLDIYHQILHRVNHLFAQTRSTEFLKRVQFVQDATLYLNNTCVKGGHLESFLTVAHRLVADRKMRMRSILRRMRIKLLCQRMFRTWYTEVCFRPEHSGAKRARHDFMHQITLQIPRRVRDQIFGDWECGFAAA